MFHIIYYAMKNLSLIAICMFFTCIVTAQNPAVEKLFNMYQGKEGFTTVLVSQDAFKVLSNMETIEGDLDNPLEKIHAVKILAQEDDAQVSGLNFYDELKKDMDFNGYKELVVVKEKDQDVWIIGREQDGRFSEMLVIVGGEDNVLIWIEGDFTFEELVSLSNLVGIDQLHILEEL